MNTCPPFEVMPLPYPANALEPAISAKTMIVHHDRLYRNYVEKLNKTLAQCPEYRGRCLEGIIKHANGHAKSELERSIHNSAGGVFNHEFFWRCMAPPGQGGAPRSRLATAICRKYGSQEELRRRFKEAALRIFGSGWMWLCFDDQGELHLLATANQDTPFQCKKCPHPVLVLDVWEHAYFLDYLSARADYIDAWWGLINWKGLPC